MPKPPFLQSTKSYLETSWYEGYYSGGERGRRREPREPVSSSSSPDDSSSGSCSQLLWIGQAVLAGISAGISYHVLQEARQRRSNHDGDSRLALVCADQLMLIPSKLHHWWDRTQQFFTRVPSSFWISAPAYVTLWFTGCYQCYGFTITSLFCGGNLYYWNYKKGKEKTPSGGEDSAQKKQSKNETGEEPKDVSKSSRNATTLKEEWQNLVTPKDAPDNAQSTHHSDVTDTTGKASSGKKAGQHHPNQYLELLVHNVSHSDLVLSLKETDTKDSTDASEIFIRPRFSCFDKYSRLVVDRIQSKDDNVIFFPRYQRSMEDPRYAIQPFPSDWDPPTSPTGFRLANPVSVDRDTLQQDVRIRGTDQAHLASAMQNPQYQPQISHVYFPLLAALLPIWERQIVDTRYSQPVKRVLILVTGVGTPRNWTHSMTGNSTQACADLMEAFLARIDPTLTVVKIHSETNIFRYDENLLFVERELMPTIHAYRDAHATGSSYPDELASWEKNNLVEATFKDVNSFDTDWRSSMNVILSFADGSPARTHAIQASLRPYRPMYFHFWQLKTFWHESKVVDDDIEVHSFETMNALPAVDVERVTDERIQAVIREMRSFYTEIALTLSNNSNDIRKFWLRKTHKPVIAVLLVQSPDMKEPQLFRGTNMEVSMPTGSLCAERNAIGSALATNPNLKRQDLKLIAVLAVPPVEPTETVNSKDADAVGMKRTTSYSSMVVDGDSSTEQGGRKGRSRNASLGSEYEQYTTNTEEWILPVPEEHLDMSAISGGDEQYEVTTGEPLRRISLFSKTTTPSERKSKRTVVVHSSKDINPLKPCGACNEWLKKISESNPYFKIVTFTDANCNGIYISPCQE